MSTLLSTGKKGLSVLCFLTLVSACDSPAPSTSRPAEKVVAQSLLSEAANGTANKYEQLTRCTGLSQIETELQLRQVIRAAQKADTQAASVEKLRDGPNRSKQFADLAMSPQFHPTGFAEAGRERRVRSDAAGYREAYARVLQFSNAKQTEQIRYPEFIKSDLAFCNGLIA
ncbi:hypothetical protein [Tateyamaria sp. SN6-1]|uniref:hypothetical protein n=1 Tax=Tateyamaria sp. SN6-1 TaxID=3092148 RepID=UPI0039F600E0